MFLWSIYSLWGTLINIQHLTCTSLQPSCYGYLLFEHYCPPYGGCTTCFRWRRSPGAREGTGARGQAALPNFWTWSGWQLEFFPDIGRFLFGSGRWPSKTQSLLFLEQQRRYLGQYCHLYILDSFFLSLEEVLHHRSLRIQWIEFSPPLTSLRTFRERFLGTSKMWSLPWPSPMASSWTLPVLLLVRWDSQQTQMGCRRSVNFLCEDFHAGDTGRGYVLSQGGKVRLVQKIPHINTAISPPCKENSWSCGTPPYNSHVGWSARRGQQCSLVKSETNGSTLYLGSVFPDVQCPISSGK